ncbi:MAG TPA: hypothetical protein VJ746_02810 [Nitrospira sp.]|nr:hypothetical protein [Nitrospira sp.]
MMTRFFSRSVILVLFLVVVWHRPALSAGTGESSGRIWKQLVMEAQQMGLPVKFLKVVPPDLVTFEFDDLQAFAAEYHLGEHRMVLNRTLSFNVAGGTLRPLKRLTHAEIETLYHELFHAYMDYLSTKIGDADPLLSFAKAQRRCRYSAVLITPVVQRKGETEERFLSEGESWEVLNEAWAVFVGWAVWNQLESGGSAGVSISKPGSAREAWLRRLQEADREGKIRGYYEPENKEERAITRKRFLAPASRISKEEVTRLMDEALGYPADLTRQAARVLASAQVDLSSNEPCR